jgi:hypothetical protein
VSDDCCVVVRNPCSIDGCGTNASDGVSDCTRLSARNSARGSACGGVGCSARCCASSNARGGLN